MTQTKKIRMAPPPPLKSSDPPSCPRHNVSMYLDRSEATWRCSTEGCRIIARRKEETSVAVTPPKANIGLEIVSNLDSEEEYVLVVSSGGQRTLVDVSDYVDMIIDEQTNSVTLCLMFHNVKRVRL